MPREMYQSSTENFIQLIKRLNPMQQLGALMITEGLRQLSEQQKSGQNNR